jgi:hypothetical protein
MVLVGTLTADPGVVFLLRDCLPSLPLLWPLLPTGGIAQTGVRRSA